MSRQTLTDQDGSLVTRRNVLTASAGLAATIGAGCLGSSGGDNSSSGGGGTPTPTRTQTASISQIESFGSKGNSLLVTLTDDANADGVALVSNDGRDTIDKERFEASDQVGLSLVDDGTPIPGGPYMVKLVKDDWNNVVGETRIVLKSKPKVTSVKLLDGDGSGDGPIPQVKVTNEGRLPAPVRYVGFPKNVPQPNPIPDKLSKTEFLKKITRTDKSQDPLISKRETGTFRSDNYPFLFKADRNQKVASEFNYTAKQPDELRPEFCNGEKVDTTLVVVVGGKHFNYPVTMTYGGEMKIQDMTNSEFVCSKTSPAFKNAPGGGNKSASNGSTGTTAE